MNYPSLDRIAALQRMIADFGKVERALMLPDADRKENDNDHSFGLALTCWYLQPKIAPQLDLVEIFKLALAHDLVEIHAGDTFVFDEVAKKSKEDRERKALKTLHVEWPDFTDLSKYAEHYMDKLSEEAKFVKAVDKLLAPIMIELSGKPEWERLNITLDMEVENKTTIRVSEYMSPYYELLIEWLDQQGTIPRREQR